MNNNDSKSKSHDISNKKPDEVLEIPGMHNDINMNHIKEITPKTDPIDN